MVLGCAPMATPAVPAEMNALIADAPVAGMAEAAQRLRLARMPVPKPPPGRVLVKVHAAVCNPADLYYLAGRYGIDRPLPAIPGFEASGEVVASGGGMLGRWLLGKKVACGGHNCSGTWAEYVEVDATQCMPLRKGLTFEQGATALVNPMTAIALVNVMKRGKHKAYVQTAAASQLGKMVVTIAAERGIPGIHIVRRADHVPALRELGAQHVLVSTEPGFDAALAAAAKELRATIALDAIAGEMTGQLMNALPPQGEVVIYGALSGEVSGKIDPMGVAFGHKHLRGFEIADYLEHAGLIGSLRLGTQAQKRVLAGKVTTAVKARVPLAGAPAALADYARKMSDGKILLTPVAA